MKTIFNIFAVLLFCVWGFDGMDINKINQMAVDKDSLSDGDILQYSASARAFQRVSTASQVDALEAALNLYGLDDGTVLTGDTTTEGNSTVQGNLTATGTVTAGDSSVSLNSSLGIATFNSTLTNQNYLNFDLEGVLKVVKMFLGPDSLFRIVRNPVDYFSGVQSFNGVATYTNNTVEASKTYGTAFSILNTTSYKLYVTKSEKFTKIAYHFAVKGSGLTLAFKYSKGGGVWGTLTVTDNTSAHTADGTVVFTAPSDWATDTVNSVTGYHIEESCSAVTTVPTAYLIVPSDANILEIYNQFNDTAAAFCVSWRGNVGINTSTPTNLFTVNGDVYTVSNFTCGTTIRSAIYGTSAASVSVTAGSTLGGASYAAYGEYQVSGSGGPVTLGANAIALGMYYGQKLRIRGTDATNTVTIPHGARVNNFGGASVVVGDGVVEYTWNPNTSKWDQDTEYNSYV